MSSSFFLKKTQKPNRKRKEPKPTKSGSFVGGKKQKGSAKVVDAGPPAKRRAKIEDEEIASDDEVLSEIEGDAGHLAFSSDDDAKEETPQDKRLRLAKQYLAEVEKQEADRAEDRELGEHVGQRLQTEYLDSVGRLRRNIAAKVQGYDTTNVITLKHKLHHGPLCALALTADGKYIFAGAKSPFVLKWNTETNKTEGQIDVRTHLEEPDNGKHRRSHVIALCVSSDMKYLALSEGGKHIQIWCPKELKHLKTFQGHRDVVTALVFRKGTHELYSGSKDRSVKIWSLDEMAYVESLFGHQTGVSDIDALSRERAITSGSTDCSLRIWKITEESQLIYNGHRDGIEHVKFINDENFISGGSDGAISFWSALKKKPICTTDVAHGKGDNEVANWITAIAVVVNTDLIASGSHDGFIRLWQTVSNARRLKLILEIPVAGFINSLVFNNDGTKLYAAVGQEHRMGRWWRVADAKNRILVFNIKQQNAT